MKIGSRAILRREPCQVLTEAAISVCWMCCGFAQSEWRGFFMPKGDSVPFDPLPGALPLDPSIGRCPLHTREGPFGPFETHFRSVTWLCICSSALRKL